MSTRPVRRRLAAATALAAFFFGSAGTALGAHRCPHHGSVGPHAVAESAESTESAERLAHHHGGHDADRDARPCSCLGTCQGTAAVAAPAAADPAHELVPPLLWPGRVPAPLPARSSLHPYLLPYANAPPRG